MNRYKMHQCELCVNTLGFVDVIDGAHISGPICMEVKCTVQVSCLCLMANSHVIRRQLSKCNSSSWYALYRFSSQEDVRI